MGNTPSAAGSSESKLKKSSSVISNPKALEATGKNTSPSTDHLHSPQLNSPSRSDNHPFRHRSSNSVSLSTPPRATVIRARSANPPAQRQDNLSVPPPYSEAVASRPYHPVTHHTVPPVTLQVTSAHEGHRRTSSHSYSGNREAAAAIAARSSTTQLSPPGRRREGFRSENDLPAGSRHAHVTIVNPLTGTAGNNTLGSAVPSTAERRTPQRQNTNENALELLKQYKTVLIVDDSSSMRDALWREVRETLAPLAETVAKYDPEGIDVHFLNDLKTGTKLRSASAVRSLFDSVRPRGMTPTGAKLEQLLQAYLYELEHMDRLKLGRFKPVNFIVMTDGAPTDDPEPVIVQAARRLDAGHFPITQVGIQFVQIGSDPDATEALRELDDGLASTHKIRDIVDTTPYTGGSLNAEMLTKILLGGINRRVDKKGARSVMK